MTSKATIAGGVLLLATTSMGCAGQRTASLATCALAGAGVGLAAGTAYGGLEGGGFETRDAAVGAFIGAGGGAVIGAFVCALIPARPDDVQQSGLRQGPSLAALPRSSAPRGEPPQP